MLAPLPPNQQNNRRLALLDYPQTSGMLVPPPAPILAPHAAQSRYYQRTQPREHPLENKNMRMAGKAPTTIVWVISLVLYVIALFAQFGVIRIDPQVATWSWIIGLGLLLLACRIRGL